MKKLGIFLSLLLMVTSATYTKNVDYTDPKYEWNSHGFVYYSGISDKQCLFRINIINMRNKFAVTKQADEKAKEAVYNYKNFSDGIRMLLKNTGRLVVNLGVYGSATIRVKDWILLYYTSEFTPDTMLSSHKPKIEKDNNLSRDYRDFDCIEDNGKVVFYKLFQATKVGKQDLVNRVYHEDKVLYWDFHINVVEK